MALPKTFTGGERLFAEDLNTNFESLDTRLSTAESDIDNVGPVFTTAGSNTVAINFSQDNIITRTATGTITFTGSNYTAGKSATVRIVAGGSNRSLVFPANWKWVALKPTVLNANQIGILTVTSFGTADTDAVAAWAWSG